MSDATAYAARSRTLATAIGRTLHRHGYHIPEPVLHSVADTVIRADTATVARIQALADEYPVAIPTNLVEAALDQDTAAPVADGSSLYDKISGMFGGPLPPPSDQPPATSLPCNHTHLRQPHDPHPWQPQPGMRHVQCPGWAHATA